MANTTFTDGSTSIISAWLNDVNKVAYGVGSTSGYVWQSTGVGNLGNWVASSNGTVTTTSVASANGFAGTVANPTTTPNITISTTITGLLKGNGTAISAATAGTDYVAPGGALGTPSSGTLTNCTFPATIATTALTRAALSASADYYVATTGNDSNPGTPGSPFLTIQKAIDVASALDNRGFQITIHVADGTYTGANTLKSYVGSGMMVIVGNTTTPSNVIISTTSNNCFTGTNCGAWTLQAMKLQTTTTGRGIVAQGPTSSLTLLNMVFGVCVSEHVLALTKSSVTFGSSYAISGSASVHLNSAQQSAISAASITVTITGTPAFLTYAACDMGSLIIQQAMTFSGSATGQKYSASLNGVIQTYGGGASYLPGSTAGATATGGQYA
jgi:hypothetical protein